MIGLFPGSDFQLLIFDQRELDFERCFANPLVEGCDDQLETRIGLRWVASLAENLSPLGIVVGKGLLQGMGVQRDLLCYARTKSIVLQVIDGFLKIDSLFKSEIHCVRNKNFKDKVDKQNR